jgi:hypothetical protein
MSKIYGRAIEPSDMLLVNTALLGLRLMKAEISPSPLIGDNSRTDIEFELFHKFNDAIDRLAVLESKLIQVRDKK